MEYEEHTLRVTVADNPKAVKSIGDAGRLYLIKSQEFSAKNTEDSALINGSFKFDDFEVTANCISGFSTELFGSTNHEGLPTSAIFTITYIKVL